MVMVSEDEKFNPASATREIFTQAINRALNDMTDAEIESLVQSAVGTEMSQRQMADLNLQSALESSVSAIRSELTLKASTSDVTAAVADEAAARQAADADLHDAVGVVAAMGAKNLLKNARTTTTHRGVTFTVNEDGSVTASGTNDGTGASLFNINAQTSLALSSGDYILTGCPAGGSETGYFMDTTRTSGASLKDTGSGVGFTVGGDYTINEFRIVISRNLTADNLTFYPMIRRAEITDSTFVPYAPTNRELYEMILALQSGVSAQSAASLMQAGRLDAELSDAQEVTDDA